MKFRIEQKNDPYAGGFITFSGEISVFDLERLRLGELDRALLDSVNCDEAATPADHLLCLEMLYRRHQEQAKEKAE